MRIPHSFLKTFFICPFIVNMRSSTLVIVPFYFLAGLVAASADKAHDIELDFEGPPSGWVCCDAGAEDADGACKAKGLNAFCVSCHLF